MEPIRLRISLSVCPPRFSGYGRKTERTLPRLVARGIASTILTRRPEGAPETWVTQDIVPVDRILPREHDPPFRILRVPRFRWYFIARAGCFDLVKSVTLPSDDPLTIFKELCGRFKIALMREVDAWIGPAPVFLPRLTAVGIHEDRFRLILNDVDSIVYRPVPENSWRELCARLDLPTGGRIIVSVGRILSRKGMDLVLRAWARINPVAGRDLLLIIGPADAESGQLISYVDHVEQIRRAANAPEIAETVRLIGESDRVAQYLSAADVFLFLSTDEGFGTVILEAMASGPPYIVSHLDGIATEFLQDGRTGFIIQNPEDPHAVASRLSGLLASRDARESMGKAARRLVIEGYSFEHRASALAALYRDVLEGSRRRKGLPEGLGGEKPGIRMSTGQTSGQPSNPFRANQWENIHE